MRPVPGRDMAEELHGHGREAWVTTACALWMSGLQGCITEGSGEGVRRGRRGNVVARTEAVGRKGEKWSVRPYGSEVVET